MNKCWLLLKIQLLGLFNINRILHTNNKKEKRRMIAIGTVMFLVILMMIGYSAGIAIAAAYYGMADILPPFILIACAACTLVITFLKSNGVLFGSRDYDMVMSLPLKNSEVIISKLLSVYAMNFLISSIIMLPSVIVYGITYKVTISIWCMLILSLFLAPLIPMMIAMIVGVIITAISVRFRYKNIVTITLSLIATLTILLGSFGIPDEKAAFKELINKAVESVYHIYPITKIYNNAIINNDWGYFGLFTFISIGISILFILLLSEFYSKINSSLFSVHSKSNYQLKTLKTSTPFMALYTKELHRLISSPTYVMNTCIGAILSIVIAVAFLFIDINKIGTIMEMPEITLWIKPLSPFVVAFFISMSSATPASISLEGKSRWLMCAAPVPPKTIFNAKIAVSLTYLIPSILISCTLLAISLKTSFIETLSLFIIPLLFAIYICVVGLAINLKFPKYDWTSEYHAVKQSASVLITVITGMVSVLTFYIIAFLLKDIPLLTLFIAIVVIPSITIIVYKRLGTKKLYF